MLDFAGGCARLSASGAFLLRSALCLLFFAAAHAYAGQPFTPADWWNWHEFDTPRINSGGTAVVYVENWNLRDAERACANLWTVPAAGGLDRSPAEVRVTPLGRDPAVTLYVGAG